MQLVRLFVRPFASLITLSFNCVAVTAAPPRPPTSNLRVDNSEKLKELREGGRAENAPTPPPRIVVVGVGSGFVRRALSRFMTLRSKIHKLIAILEIIA